MPLTPIDSPSTPTTPSLTPPDTPTDTVTVGMELRLTDLIRLSELGSGASGTIVKALHVPSLTVVALKTVSVFDQQDRHQLVKELNGFTTAHGPHILRFVGACFSEGSCVMALELMNRGSLEQLVGKYGPLRSEPALRHILRQVLLGLSDLAKLHCVHRDIKPGNILIDSEGVVRISDFGLLRQLDHTQDLCNTFLGTMSFLSPERITGDVYSTKSDVWSVGVSVVYLVRGKLAMPTEYWSLLSVVNAQAPRLTVEGDGVSAELCDLVARMLEKDPETRWSADQLLSHPFMQTTLTEGEAMGGWPVGDWVEPDKAELSLIVEAVVREYYEGKGSEDLGVEDMQRFMGLARQLGCSPHTVTQAFVDRLGGGEEEGEAEGVEEEGGVEEVGPIISYQAQSRLHSRGVSHGVVTMAEEERSRSRGGSIGQTASALSAKLGSALTMRERVREGMSEGVGKTMREPLSLAALRAAVALHEGKGEEEKEESEGEHIAITTTYAYPVGRQGV